MNHAKLLDCTLRDGAYLIDKTFGDESIKGITQGLTDAKIDYIEIGFFQNDGFGPGKTVFLNSEEAVKFIPKDKNGCKYSVLADCSRYDISNLDERRDDSIDAVRECFFKEEREQAMENCRIIKQKGYLLFVQPVDIMGYSDRELLDLIEEVNSIEPYCLSIVDTFGSMYQEDLHRVFELIHHNLVSTCKVGFHSHNNMQLSNALSQEFIRITAGKRDVIVDGTLAGMGRGAGNTPTELIAQYMVSKMQSIYDMDAILDILDIYMENIKSKCSWGYNTPYFVAGCYSAHVNNIAFLKEKNSIRSKDIRYILNKIGSVARKRYDYNLLETTYMDYLQSELDDTSALKKLQDEISDRPILVMAPGKSVLDYQEKISSFIQTKYPVIITINFIPKGVPIDYLYMSNLKRYQYWSNSDEFKNVSKIITSNLPEKIDGNSLKISFTKYVKCGWEHMDNSTIMLLRLLDCIGINKVYIAGFDGYDSYQRKNYYSENLELISPQENAIELNEEIEEMFLDFLNTRKNKDMVIKFITQSRFEKVLK